MSYLFDYKITIDNKCGFPKIAYNKVINRLEEEKISYQVISKDENHIVKDYKNINNYDNILIKAIDYIDFRNKRDWLKHKVDNICDIETLERFYQKLKDELF